MQGSEIEVEDSNSNPNAPSSGNSPSSNNEQKKTCADCGTTKTPLWRGGPAGPKVSTLTLISISQIAPRGFKPTLDLTLLIAYHFLAVSVQRVRDQKQEEEESDPGNQQGEHRGRKERKEDRRRRRNWRNWRWRVGEGSVVAPIALEEARRGRESCGLVDVALLWIRLCLNQINQSF